MGAFKLGRMTFGSMFKKPETIMYPIEVKPQPAGLKGHVAIDVDNCILCGMCDRSCSTDCITVDKQARTWVIDRLQCVQCGYCITVCPKKCLSMDPNYAPATTVHAPDSFKVPEQSKPSAGKADRPSGSQTAAQAAEVKPAARIELAAAADSAAAAAVADSQLEALIKLMDDEKAAMVREALKA